MGDSPEQREGDRLDAEAALNQPRLAESRDHARHQAPLDQRAHDPHEAEHASRPGVRHPEPVGGEEAERLLHAGEPEKEHEVDGHRDADARDRDRGAKTGQIDGRGAPHRLPAPLGRQRFGQGPERHQQVDGGETGRHQRREHPLASEGVEPRQLAADEGAEDEAEAEGDPDDRHPARAALGRRHVGDVGLRDGDVRGGDAAPDARHKQPDQGRREAEHRHPDRRGGDAPEQHRPPPHAIREPPPDRDEQELHDGEDRARHRGHEVAGPEAARDAGEKRDHQPEAEQVEEDREEQRAERGVAEGLSRGGRGRGGGHRSPPEQAMARLMATRARDHQAPVARRSARLAKT